MPKAISPEVDYNILTDIALNVPSKEIAIKYGVSLSYISKIRTGKKKVNYITSNIVSKDFIIPLEKFIFDNRESLKGDVTDSLTNMIISKLEEVKVLIIAREAVRQGRK